MNGNPINVLLVEDNPDHAELVIRNLLDHRIANKIFHVSDGEEALDYIYNRGAYSNSEENPRPDVILLDLRLPKIDGIQVLSILKADDKYRFIPVVILTTSGSDKDVINAYDKYVNSYLIKPLDHEKFTRMVNSLGFYWLCWNRSPWKK